MDIAKHISAYREPYDNALAELSELLERLEELDVEREAVITRIGEVKEGISALAPLVKENPVETHPDLFPDHSETGADLGLTDGIRRVLANSAPKRLTPVGVRTGLGAIGFQTKSKNILPSIHTVLKRLEKNNEVTSKTEEDGRTWYRWNQPVYKPEITATHGGSGRGFSATEGAAARAVDDLIRMRSTPAGRALEKTLEEAEKFDKYR